MNAWEANLEELPMWDTPRHIVADLSRLKRTVLTCLRLNVRRYATGR